MKAYLRFVILMITVWALIDAGNAQAQLEWETITTENAENLIEIANSDLGEAYVNNITFSPDGLTLAIATNEGIQLMDIGSGTVTELLDESYLVLQIAYHPDGSLIAFSGAGNRNRYGVFMVDAETGDEELFMEVPLQLRRASDFPLVTALTFNSEGTLLAYATNTIVMDQSVANMEGMEQGTVHVVDLQEEEEILTLEEDQAVLGTLYFTPDESQLVYSALNVSDIAHRRGGTIHFCDLSTGEEINEIEADALTSAFNPDGTLMAATGEAVFRFGAQTYWLWGFNALPVFETGSGDIYDVFEYDSDTYVVFNNAAFNRDGSLLAAVSVGPFEDGEATEVTQGRLHLWDVDSRDELVTVVLGNTQLATLAFSPDGTHIATLYSSHPEWHDMLQLWAVVPEGVCTVTANNSVNLRAGPGTNYDIVGSLAAGEEAYVAGQLEADDGYVWYHLLSGAWVRSDLVTPANECADLPEVEAP